MNDPTHPFISNNTHINKISHVENEQCDDPNWTTESQNISIYIYIPIGSTLYIT